MTVTAVFDRTRVITAGGDFIRPFRVKETRPLSDVLKRGEIRGDAPVLVVERGDAAIVLLTSQMSYYHVAQGQLSGTNWGVFF
ncbi:MAG: hypothetical protein JW765_06150 [Deltaproteobacteria bacterium]|nr:hypothetical protein [Candidatus Zymogenaceae bacterium]